MQVLTRDVRQLIASQIQLTQTQWSVGTFGGVAEFSCDVGEEVTVASNDTGVSAFTTRGGVGITFHDDIRPFASESATRLGWSHRVSLCLPQASAQMNRRKVLTELGPDTSALRSQDRDAVLFDLGLDVLQADLCIRVADPAVVGELRACVGRALDEPGNPAGSIVFAANPHRVFISRIGRAEVYQPIPPADGKSPEGPHTHLFPKVLKSKRSHSANEMVPDGFVPCAHFYPAHPTSDGLGRPRPFDLGSHQAFQSLLQTYGDPANGALKSRVLQAVRAGDAPFDSASLVDRFGRATMRVTLRQLKAAGETGGALSRWLEAFDRAELVDEDDDNEARTHGG